MSELTVTYVPYTMGPFDGLRRSDLGDDVARALVDRLPVITATERCERVDGTGSRFSYRCTTSDGRELHLKVVHPRSAFRRLVEVYGTGTIGEVATLNALALERKALATPAARLLLVARRGSRCGTSWIFTDVARPATFIEPFIHRGYDGADPADDVRTRAGRIRAWAAFVRAMHDRGVFHMDLSNYNVFVRPDSVGRPSFELVDLDMLVPLADGDGIVARALRVLELVVMNAMFKDRDFRRLDKLRFLVAYFGRDGFRRIMTSPWWRRVAALSSLGRSSWFRRPAFAGCRLLVLAGLVDRPAPPKGGRPWVLEPAPSPRTR